MLEESYVSFELAKLLKEKNFPIVEHSQYSCYKQDGKLIYDCPLKQIDAVLINLNNEEEQVLHSTEYTYAPTLSLVSKWLREEKDLAICIESSQRDNHCYWINKIDEFHPDAEYVSPNVFKTYDEALADAIETVLKYLL